MSARLIETEEGVSFRAECDCSGSWSPLLATEGASEGFGSWNYRHGIGGLSLTCGGCRETWVLGGCVTGEGLPDLIHEGELGELPRVDLTPLQRRLLDVSLVAEEAIWLKGMDLVRAAELVGATDQAESFRLAAVQMRQAAHLEKAKSLVAILEEHGIDGLPPTLRIARRSDGSGAIYSVDRGPLPVRKKALEAEPSRVVDLTPYSGDLEVPAEAGRVVDLG